MTDGAAVAPAFCPSCKCDPCQCAARAERDGLAPAAPVVDEAEARVKATRSLFRDHVEAAAADQARYGVQRPLSSDWLAITVKGVPLLPGAVASYRVEETKSPAGWQPTTREGERFCKRMVRLVAAGEVEFLGVVGIGATRGEEEAHRFVTYQFRRCGA